ncbi:hypothetical protein ACFL4T_01715 [candidate division KSB1 bacterium]
MIKYLADNLWKDTYYFNSSLRHFVTQDFTLDYFLNTINYNDRHTGLNNDYGNLTAGISPAFNYKNFDFTGAISGVTDKRMAKKDNGLNLRFSMENNNLSINDYKIDIASNLENEKLGNRRNYHFVNKLTFWKRFISKSSDSLSVSWNENRYDYYISPNLDIESRKTLFRKVHNTLNYFISEKTSVNLQSFVSLGRTEIKYPFKSSRGEKTRDDFVINNVFRLNHVNNGKYFDVVFGFDNTEHNYKLSGDGQNKIAGLIPFDTPSSKSKTVFLSTDFRGNFFRKDSVNMSFYVEKHSYDTPSKINNDDRDELRINMQISHFYKIRPDLLIGGYLNIHLNHLVFLFKERSIENNWNRIFIFGTRVGYINPRFILRNSCEVISNYTDYDYEEYLPAIRSFVFRKFSNLTDFVYNLSKKSSLNMFLKLEKEENGMLDWSKFKQNVIFSKINWNFRTNYSYQISENFTIFSGIEFLSRKYVSGIDIRSGSFESKNLDDFGVSFGFLFKSDKLTSRFNLLNRRIVRGGGKSLFQTAEISMNYSI